MPSFPRWSLLAVSVLQAGGCTANQPSTESAASGSASDPAQASSATHGASTTDPRETSPNGASSSSTDDSPSGATNGATSTNATEPDDSAADDTDATVGVTAPGADSSAPSDSTLPDGVPARGIAVVGRAVYVDGKLFHIKGVNWNPVARGKNHPADLDFAGFADVDIPLMKAAGINAVRTYERLENREVLDKLHAAGIYVFSTVLGWWQDDAEVV